MSSGRTKRIEVPLFVLNLGLLYAFLLAVSHILAWVCIARQEDTIVRHEKTIEELREMMVEMSVEQGKVPLTAMGMKGDDGKDDDDSEVIKVCFPSSHTSTVPACEISFKTSD